MNFAFRMGSEGGQHVYVYVYVQIFTHTGMY